MSEQKKVTADELSSEIEIQRLHSRLAAERIVLSEINATMANLMKEGQEKIESDGLNNENRKDSSDSAETSRVPFMANPMGWILGGYAVLVASIMASLLYNGYSKPICNNACVILVAILVLSTVVVILGGRYCILMHQLHNERIKEDRKEVKNRIKAEPSFKEQALNRIQEAVLEIIVKDTIKSFNSKQ